MARLRREAQCKLASPWILSALRDQRLFFMNQLVLDLQTVLARRQFILSAAPEAVSFPIRLLQFEIGRHCKVRQICRLIIADTVLNTDRLERCFSVEQTIMLIFLTDDLAGSIVCSAIAENTVRDDHEGFVRILGHIKRNKERRLE